MEDHLPLDPALGREEGGSVEGKDELHRRGAGQAGRRAEAGRGGSLDGKQHTRVVG